MKALIIKIKYNKYMFVCKNFKKKKSHADISPSYRKITTKEKYKN